MYPSENKSIFNNWKEFVSFTLPYMQKNIRDKESLKKLKTLSDIQDKLSNDETVSFTSNKYIIIYFILFQIHFN